MVHSYLQGLLIGPRTSPQTRHQSCGPAPTHDTHPALLLLLLLLLLAKMEGKTDIPQPMKTGRLPRAVDEKPPPLALVRQCTDATTKQKMQPHKQMCRHKDPRRATRAQPLQRLGTASPKDTICCEHSTHRINTGLTPANRRASSSVKLLFILVLRRLTSHCKL